MFQIGKFLNEVANGIKRFNDGALVTLTRKRRKSGSREIADSIRMGPNMVHAFINHADGSFTDLGMSKNLLTNIGRDWMSAAFGGFQAAGNTLASNISTATSATTITGTGSVWTASNLATPQLGVAGMRVFAAPNTSTNPVVWGNVISNTTNVLTIDQWWKLPAAAGGVPIAGTTPTSGDAFVLGHGTMASCQFMALTTDSGAASAADTSLASEITTAGAGRALATYAHTMGQATFTLQKAYSITGTLTAVHKMGLYCSLTASTGIMVFETVLNQDATVGNGDTLTVTDTVTCSG